MKLWVATLAFCAMGLTAGAQAETVLVRSGEHEGFSRLVIKPDQPTEWTFGRTDAGYELRLGGNAVALDASRVFDLIPRSRIVAVETAAAGSALAVAVAEGHFATAFMTATGSIVIDVAPGSAPAESRFEKPIDAVPTELAAAEAVALGAATPGPPTVVEKVETAPAAPPEADVPSPEPTRRLSPRTQFAPDARLAAYWKAPPPPLEATAPEGTQTAGRMPHPDFITPLDRRVAEAEAQLLIQLGRAASQGLIEPAEPPRQTAAASGHPVDGTPPAAADVPEPTHKAVEPGGAAEENLHANADTSEIDAARVHSETSIDRELQPRLTQNPVTADGEACLQDADFALQDWGDDRDFRSQLAEARNSLVGEFDIPAPDAVAKLARLYLHFGFGVEAVAALSAFNVAPRDAATLAEIALIMEDGQGSAAGPFAGMADCDTSAALWAVLAQPRLEPGETVNHGATIRAFSGLPLHLRRQLGTDLANRFIGAGDTQTARAIRDAITRAPGDPGTSVGMIDAHLDLADGDAKSAERLLEAVVAEDGPLSPEAAILAVQSMLDRGAPVDPRLTETIGALAFERRMATDGPELSRSHILALASHRSFEQAFDALERWRESGDARLQRETTSELFAMLALPEAALDFLNHYFANRGMIDDTFGPAALRLELAGRLLEQGFTNDARELLGEIAQDTMAGRILLARAALADFDAESALRHVAGFEGPEAARLRGAAFARLGRHGEAAAAFLEASEPALAAEQAWRGGDWALVADLASDPKRSAVTRFGLAPGPADQTAATGPAGPIAADATQSDAPASDGTLAAGQALLDDSRSARAELELLLNDTPPIVENSVGLDG